MYPNLKSMRFNWCLVLCLLNIGTLVGSSKWPLHSLMFHYNADGVTAEMELHGDGNSPGNAEITCGSNLSWTPTAELNLTGEVVNVNATGSLAEGSHAVCLMNNVPFLNLSVPCLFKDGVPKPIITGLRAIKISEDNCLLIEWAFNANSSQVDHWEIYSMDNLAYTSLVQNSTVAYEAKLCFPPYSEWAYCCVAVNLMLNGSSFRSCDCQHITLAEPSQPQVNVYGITAQRKNNSICIEFDFEFTGSQVISAGVCCTPSNMLLYQTCQKKDVTCHLKRINSSWCDSYGRGNYLLYCYAFIEFNTNDGIGIVKSSIFSSPIHGLEVQDIHFSFHSQIHERCFVVHYTIPKSFYHLQEVRLCCGTFGCENKTVETSANLANWHRLRINITHCESASIGDLSMECELKNIFYPNMMVSNNVSIVEPVKVLAAGFLEANRSEEWARAGDSDTKKEVCFRLKVIVTGKLDKKPVSDCCTSNESSKEYCVKTGDLLCIESYKIEPTAYCYGKINGVDPEISNIIEKNIGKPSMYKIFYGDIGGGRAYILGFLKDYLDRNSHNGSEIVRTNMVHKNFLIVGDISYIQDEAERRGNQINIIQLESDEQFQITLKLQYDHNPSSYYYATYLIPEYQSLSNIRLEKIYFHNKICVNFTWENLKTPPSNLPAQIENVGYAVITCTGCSNTSTRVNFNESIDSNPYSEASQCISNVNACGCELECSIEVRYFDAKDWLVAIGKSHVILVEPACIGFKDVHIAPANLSCIEVSWQNNLGEEIAYYKVTCSNSPLQYNVTNLTMLVCGLSYYTAVNCTVSAMFPDGQSIEGFSNTIITPCDRPGRVEKIEAAPEITVDRTGHVIAVIWNITWQPVLPNCQYIGYYFVTIEEKSKNYFSETCRSWLTFKSSAVNERFSMEVFAINNMGLNGDRFEESFIYEEYSPIVYFTSINSSCALYSIIYPLPEQPVARYIDVDCVLNEHNETVLNLTMRSLNDVSIPVCLPNTTGTLRCSAAYRNFPGVSSTASTEYILYAETSTTVAVKVTTTDGKLETAHESSTRRYKNTEFSSAEDDSSFTEYHESHDSPEDFTMESDQTTIENLKDKISTNSASKTPIVKAPTPSLQKVMESTSGDNYIIADLSSTSQSADKTTIFTVEGYYTAQHAHTTEKTEDNPQKLENTSPSIKATLPYILLSFLSRLL